MREIHDNAGNLRRLVVNLQFCKSIFFVGKLKSITVYNPFYNFLQKWILLCRWMPNKDTPHQDSGQQKVGTVSACEYNFIHLFFRFLNGFWQHNHAGVPWSTQIQLNRRNYTPSTKLFFLKSKFKD